MVDGHDKTSSRSDLIASGAASVLGLAVGLPALFRGEAALAILFIGLAILVDLRVIYGRWARTKQGHGQSSFFIDNAKAISTTSVLLSFASFLIVIAISRFQADDDASGIGALIGAGLALVSIALLVLRPAHRRK